MLHTTKHCFALLHLFSSSHMLDPPPPAGPYTTTTANVSAVFDTQLTPSGWTFNIWSVIYIWLTAMIIYILSGICRKSASLSHMKCNARLGATWELCSDGWEFLSFPKERWRLRLLQPCSVAVRFLHKLVCESGLQYWLAAGLGPRVRITPRDAPPTCSGLF